MRKTWPQESWGSSSNPSLNGHSHDHGDIHRTLNETACDKILQHRADYKNRPSNSLSFITDMTSRLTIIIVPLTLFPFWRILVVCLGEYRDCEFVCLLFFQTHRETDRFFAASGVQFAQSNLQYHYRRVACWENIWCMSNIYSPTREYVVTHTIYPLHLLLSGHM
jgi:hypothetical protein